MAAIIVGGLGLLGTTIMGISIKEILPTAFAFSWKLFLTYRHSKLIIKLSKMIITYTDGKYPHKELLKEMKKMIKDLFKGKSKKDLVKTIQYYKELKDLFYAVNFGDSYWALHKKELIINPEKLRDYMIKKIYIERIKDIIVVKLYNNILSKEDLTELENDLFETYLNNPVSISKLDEIVQGIEEECKKQYKELKERYDNDFKDEKIYLKDILEKVKLKIKSRSAKNVLLITQEIVEDCRNDLESDNYTSRFLQRTRSLSKTSLESIEEQSSKSSNPILNLLN